MKKEIYLKPLTLKEFLYASTSDVFEPKNAYSLIKELSEIIPILSHKFFLPEELKPKKENELEVILKSIKYTQLPKIEKPQKESDPLSTIARVNETYGHIYELLSPINIWKQKSADCKGFSLLSVSFLRKNGIPSRPRLYSKNHMIFEKYENGIWKPKDPQNLSLNPANIFPLKEDFYTYYELILS